MLSIFKFLELAINSPNVGPCPASSVQIPISHHITQTSFFMLSFYTRLNFPRKLFNAYFLSLYLVLNPNSLIPLNPLNAELNPICHSQALLEAHHILHVSGIRVKLIYSDKSRTFTG
jgi:hypothetical protein